MTRSIPRLLRYAAVGAGVAAAGYVGLVTGACPLDLGVGRVVVVGLATDYCVKETALDAVRLGFDTVVLGGLVRAVDLQPGDGQRALAAMRAAGASVEPPA